MSSVLFNPVLCLPRSHTPVNCEEKQVQGFTPREKRNELTSYELTSYELTSYKLMRTSSSIAPKAKWPNRFSQVKRKNTDVLQLRTAQDKTFIY